MSFKHNLDICKNLRTLDNATLCSLKTIINDRYKKVPSFNSESNLFSTKHKITHIIVGTLTPFKGRENGYFYSANNGNAQINLLNMCFPNIKIKEKYEALSKNPKDKVKINEIKDILSYLGIAFLDVIKEAYSLNYPNASPSDNLIYPFVLDRESFKTALEINPNMVFICNSINSKEALEIILERKKPVRENFKQGYIRYCPQINFHTSNETKVALLKDCLL